MLVFLRMSGPSYPALAETRTGSGHCRRDKNAGLFLVRPATCPRHLTPLQTRIRESLEKDLKQCQSLGTTPDGKGLFLTTQTQSPAIVREIARLREATFRPVGEGSGYERDTDQFERTTTTCSSGATTTGTLLARIGWGMPESL